jgi:hypothetical protein
MRYANVAKIERRILTVARITSVNPTTTVNPSLTSLTMMSKQSTAMLPKKTVPKRAVWPRLRESQRRLRRLKDDMVSGIPERGALYARTEGAGRDA